MLQFDLDLREFNKSSFQIINGYVSTDVTLDNDVKLSVTGMKMEGERWITDDKTYIQGGKLCKTLNAILSSDYASMGNFCPVSAGVHPVKDFVVDALGILFRNEMLGFKKLQVKLKNEDGVVGCYVVDVITY